MTILSQDIFLCTVCKQEKNILQKHNPTGLRFVLCKSCASIGKYCPRCEKYKLFPEFHKDGLRSDGVVAHCKTCKSNHSKNAYNPSKSREYRLTSRFNITQKEYDVMFQSQNGVCAICKRPETAMDNTGTNVRALAVDHDHKTGNVRQLLCGYCNYLIGYAKDNAELLQSASDYLKKHDKLPHEWPEGGRLL